jgi:hypothetical protein
LNRSLYGEDKSRLLKAFLPYIKPCNEKVFSVFNATAENLRYIKTMSPEIDLESFMLQIDDRRDNFFKTVITQEYDSEEFERFTVVPGSIHNILSLLYKISIAIEQMNEGTLTSAPVRLHDT